MKGLDLILIRLNDAASDQLTSSLAKNSFRIKALPENRFTTICKESRLPVILCGVEDTAKTISRVQEFETLSEEATRVLVVYGDPDVVRATLQGAQSSRVLGLAPSILEDDGKLKSWCERVEKLVQDKSQAPPKRRTKDKSLASPPQQPPRRSLKSTLPVPGDDLQSVKNTPAESREANRVPPKKAQEFKKSPVHKVRALQNTKVKSLTEELELVRVSSDPIGVQGDDESREEFLRRTVRHLEKDLENAAKLWARLSQENAEFEGRNAELSSHLNNQDRRITELEGKLSAKRNALNLKHADLEVLREESKTQLRANKKLAHEYEEAQTKLTQTRSDLSSVQSQLKQSESRSSKLQSQSELQRKQVQETLSASQETLKNLELKHEKSLEAIQSQHKNEIEQVQHKLLHLKEANATLRHDVSELEQQSQSVELELERKSTAYQTLKSEHETQIAKHHSALAIWKDTEEEMRTTMLEQSKVNAEMKAELKSSETKIEALSQEIEDTRNTLLDSIAAKRELQSKIDSAQLELRKHEEENDALKNQLKAIPLLEERIATEEANLHQERDAKNKLAIKLRESQFNVEELSAKNETLKNEVKDATRVEAERNALRDELSRTKNQCDNLSHTLKGRDALLADRHRELKALEQNLKNSREEIANQETHQRSLEENVKRLTIQVDSMSLLVDERTRERDVNLERIRKANAKIESQQRNFEKLKDIQAENLVETQKIRDRYADACQKLEDKESELSDMNSQNREFKTQLRDREEAHRQSKEELFAAENKHKILMNQIERQHQSLLNQHEQQLKELGATTDNANRELKALEKTTQDLRAREQKLKNEIRHAEQAYEGLKAETQLKHLELKNALKELRAQAKAKVRAVEDKHRKLHVKFDKEVQDSESVKTRAKQLQEEHARSQDTLKRLGEMNAKLKARLQSYEEERSDRDVEAARKMELYENNIKELKNKLRHTLGLHQQLKRKYEAELHKKSSQISIEETHYEHRLEEKENQVAQKTDELRRQNDRLVATELQLKKQVDAHESMKIKYDEVMNELARTRTKYEGLLNKIEKAKRNKRRSTS